MAGAQRHPQAYAPEETLADNIVRLAQAALDNALSPLQSELHFKTQFWQSVNLAVENKGAVFSSSVTAEFVCEQQLDESHQAGHLEITLKAPPPQQSDVSECTLGADFESMCKACPEMRKLFNSTCMQVHWHLMPMLTPSLIYSEYFDTLPTETRMAMTDEALDKAYLNGLAEEWGYDSIREYLKIETGIECPKGTNPVDIYAEQVNDLLPSHMRAWCGKESLVIIDDPLTLAKKINETLARLQKQAAPHGQACEALQSMACVMRSINQGVRFFDQPMIIKESNIDQRLWVFSSHLLSVCQRPLDELNQHWMETCEGIDCVAYFNPELETPAMAHEWLDNLHQGARALQTFCKLLHSINQGSYYG
jgi:hypothetical protein